MITSMIPNVENVFKNHHITNLTFFSAYNPLINYDWSTTTTSGLRYLKDVGSTPTYNASMYFGRGAYFNGVDQCVGSKTFGELNVPTSPSEVTICAYISDVTSGTICNTGYASTYEGVSLQVGYGKISINSNSNENSPLETPYISGMVVCTLKNNVWSIYINGILKVSRLFTYTTPFSFSATQVFSIGAYRVSSQYCIGKIKDVSMFTRVLSQSEITQSYEQPEAFYAMAQADSTCVLNMPMCETDGYARNMKSYSEGNELDTSFVAGNYTSTTTTARIAQFNLGLVVEANKTYLVEIEYDDTANSILTGYSCYGEKGDGTYTNFHTALKGIVNGTKGTAFYLIQTPSTYLGLSSTTAYAWITTTTSGKTAYISVRSLKQLTGVYPIINYTSSVRTNAKNLQYGLQTCKFVRDSLGVIQSASDYLEPDGVGYAIMPNTFMSASPTTEAYEFIIKQATTLDTQYYIKWTTLGQSSAISTIELTKNSLSSGFLRYRSSNGGGLAIKTEDWINSKMYITFVCNSAKAYIYVNGILRYTENTPNNHLLLNNIYLFSESTTYNVEKMTSGGSFRLFKVHNKALTQAEITANYNSYVAKGLLT